MKRINLLLICFLSYVNAYAQGLDPAPAGVMISHAHPKGNWMFSYTYMNTSQQKIIRGTAAVSDNVIYNKYLMAPHSMHMDMHMLMGMYGVTGKFTLMAMANYNHMSMTMNMIPGSLMFMNGEWVVMGPANSSMKMKSSGISDCKLYGIYKLRNGESSTLVGSMGINIPTGSIQLSGDSAHMNQGQHMTYMMQMGSGTVDIIPGITYLKRCGKITWSTQMNAIIRPTYNSQHYRYGNELNVNGWAAWRMHPKVSASLRCDATFSGSIMGYDSNIEADLEPGANPANYGGMRIAGYAGINYYINKGVLSDSKIALEFGLPVYQQVNGIQLANRSTLFASYIIDL